MGAIAAPGRVHPVLDDIGAAVEASRVVTDPDVMLGLSHDQVLSRLKSEPARA